MAPVGSRYTVSPDQTYVTDNWTKLVWRRKVDAAPLTLGAAATTCAVLGFGWRLPTVKELFSLIDPRLEPTIDSEAFPDTPSAPFWSGNREFAANRPASVNFGVWGAWGPGATQALRQQVGGEDVAHVRCVR
jgi:hypothetical protein